MAQLRRCFDRLRGLEEVAQGQHRQEFVLRDDVVLVAVEAFECIHGLGVGERLLEVLHADREVVEAHPTGDVEVQGLESALGRSVGAAHVLDEILQGDRGVPHRHRRRRRRRRRCGSRRGRRRGRRFSRRPRGGGGGRLRRRRLGLGLVGEDLALSLLEGLRSLEKVPQLEDAKILGGRDKVVVVRIDTLERVDGLLRRQGRREEVAREAVVFVAADHPILVLVHAREHILGGLHSDAREVLALRDRSRQARAVGGGLYRLRLDDGTDGLERALGLVEVPQAQRAKELRHADCSILVDIEAFEDVVCLIGRQGRTEQALCSGAGEIHRFQESIVVAIELQEGVLWGGRAQTSLEVAQAQRHVARHHGRTCGCQVSRSCRGQRLVIRCASGESLGDLLWRDLVVAVRVQGMEGVATLLG
mmetsp:Transcript_135221/g.432243  ORF Transcript_135221/g.432243 Transcript_135221/m.432243 type:complete len:418 (-) Transcript_135221:2493-3746(-)